MKHKISSAAKVIAGFALLATIIPAGSTYATTEEEAAVESVVNSLRTIYQTAVNEYNTANPENQQKLTENEYNEDATISYKPSAVNAYFYLNKTYGFEVTRASEEGVDTGMDAAIQPATEKLTNLGFSTYYEGNYLLMAQYINNTTGVVCSLGGSTVECGHTSWLTITDEWKEFANSIGAAYFAEKGEYPILRTTVLPLYESKYKPYQYTFVGVYGSSMFYRSSPTSKWIYFADGMDHDCSQYTGEAQKGFAGYLCRDGDKTVEISVPSNLVSEKEDTVSNEANSVAVPNTGATTNNDQGAITTTFIAVLIAASSILVGATYYAKNRLASKVSFKKQ